MNWGDYRRCLAIATVFACLFACKKQETELGNSQSEKEPVPVKRAPVLPSVSIPQRERYSIDHWPSEKAASDDPWVQRFLAAKSETERIELIGEKEASGPEHLAPLIRRALQYGSEELAINALESARSLTGDDALDVLSGATTLSSENIAVIAFEISRNADDDIRLEIYKNTMTSPHTKVREMTMVELSRERNKLSIPLLIEGLSDTAPEVQESTRKSLLRIFEQEFQAANQAYVWWNENQHRYNENLVQTSL
jgi:hypothetical protein